MLAFNTFLRKLALSSMIAGALTLASCGDDSDEPSGDGGAGVGGGGASAQRGSPRRPPRPA